MRNDHCVLHSPPHSLPVALIGGSGFIGTRLCKRLADKRPFRIIDKRMSADFPEHVTLADVRDLSALTCAIPDNAIVTNLAAEHRDDVKPLSLYEAVNVGGARNCCDAATSRGVKTIIFTSSVAVYGFAKPGTGEDGEISPFNEYGRTKYDAEQVYRKWQAESPSDRALVIIRPTVVFGECNRGNVYNLMRQIALGRFIMIGNGQNRKSIAYVENVAAFIEYCLQKPPGVHVFNYVDQPDYDMNTLTDLVCMALGKNRKPRPRLPATVAFGVARACDIFSRFSGKNLAVSAIRVRKFMSNSTYSSSIDKKEFVAPVGLREAIFRTIDYEFFGPQRTVPVFQTE